VTTGPGDVWSALGHHLSLAACSEALAARVAEAALQVRFAMPQVISGNTQQPAPIGAPGSWCQMRTSRAAMASASEKNIPTYLIYQRPSPLGRPPDLAGCASQRFTAEYHVGWDCTVGVRVCVFRFKTVLQVQSHPFSHDAAVREAVAELANADAEEFDGYAQASSASYLRCVHSGWTPHSLCICSLFSPHPLCINTGLPPHVLSLFLPGAPRAAAAQGACVCSFSVQLIRAKLPPVAGKAAHAASVYGYDISPP
jgi:hypothetical protein